MKLDMSEFMAMTDAERRAYFADYCSNQSDEQIAADVVLFISGVPDTAPANAVLKQVARIIGDVRAGERLRLSRLQ